MGTLNQYASRIASLVNQPNNHELKERIKDMIKTMFANRIRQSIEKNGIDNILKLSFIAPVEELAYNNILPTEYRIANKLKILGTKYKIPVPIRIHNDAPFTFVGNTLGEPYMYENSITSIKLRQSVRQTHFPTGSTQSYTILNGHIIIIKQDIINNILDNRNINEILITGIFENPDEVLSFFKDTDGQDIELPLPNDMLESIIQEILKTEFNIYPKDVDIKINNEQPSVAQNTDKRN